MSMLSNSPLLKEYSVQMMFSQKHFRHNVNYHKKRLIIKINTIIKKSINGSKISGRLKSRNVNLNEKHSPSSIKICKVRVENHSF